jgi:hypothetical protein
MLLGDFLKPIRMTAKFLVFGAGLKKAGLMEDTSGFLIRAFEGSVQNCRQQIQNMFPDLDLDVALFAGLATDVPGVPDIAYFGEGVVPPGDVPAGLFEDDDQIYDKIIIVKLPTQQINFTNVDPAEEAAEEAGNANNIEIPDENVYVPAFNPEMSGGRRRRTRRQHKKRGRKYRSSRRA